MPDVNDVFKKHDPVNEIVKTLQNNDEGTHIKNSENCKKGYNDYNKPKVFSKVHDNTSPRSMLKAFFINFCKTAFDSVKYDLSQYNLMKNDFCLF